MGIEITAIDARIEKISLSGMAGAAALLQRTGPINMALLGIYGQPVIGAALAAYNMIAEMPGTVVMVDTSTMVHNVLGRLSLFRKLNAKRNISRLNILDHGAKGRMEIGSDVIDDTNIGAFAKVLGLLKGNFDQDGYVHLQNCEIGTNEKLLAAFARIVGVPVYAGTGYHHGVLRLNTGDYVRANPDGTINRDVRRP